VRDLSSIVDRLGRILVDMAPHFHDLSKQPLAVSLGASRTDDAAR
jgi:hypothetical protein